jgi:hypothetical protein
VRVATVWHDSVLTSGSSNLLVGRYHDPRLGTIMARSYFQVGLGGAYAPDEVYDSLVLVLKPDAYRYDDAGLLCTQVNTEGGALSPLHPFAHQPGHRHHQSFCAGLGRQAFLPGDGRPYRYLAGAAHHFAAGARCGPHGPGSLHRRGAGPVNQA